MIRCEAVKGVRLLRWGLSIRMEARLPAPGPKTLGGLNVSACGVAHSPERAQFLQALAERAGRAFAPRDWLLKTLSPEELQQVRDGMEFQRFRNMSLTDSVLEGRGRPCLS